MQNDTETIGVIESPLDGEAPFDEANCEKFEEEAESIVDYLSLEGFCPCGNEATRNGECQSCWDAGFEGRANAYSLKKSTQEKNKRLLTYVSQLPEAI